MREFELKTPVLYLVFNRLDSVKRTFSEIQKAKPKELFVACDGPRTKKEKGKTDAIRKYILKNISWKCEIKTLFRDKNLGCGPAVAAGIDWFFENVERGIILEDDCLPDQSFFRFCQEMLEKYNDDNEVMCIGGYNPLDKFDTKNSYVFSKNPLTWGWGTWKRAWAKRDQKIYEKISGKMLKHYWPNPIDRFFRKITIDHILNGRVSVWDSQWAMCIRLNGGVAIVPKHNLVKNIGFSEDSTHTKPNRWDRRYLDRERHSLDFPLKHPERIEVDEKFDNKKLFQEIKRKLLKNVFFF